MKLSELQEISDALNEKNFEFSIKALSKIVFELGEKVEKIQKILNKMEDNSV